MLRVIYCYKQLIDYFNINFSTYIEADELKLIGSMEFMQPSLLFDSDRYLCLSDIDYIGFKIENKYYESDEVKIRFPSNVLKCYDLHKTSSSVYSIKYIEKNNYSYYEDMWFLKLKKDIAVKQFVNYELSIAWALYKFFYHICLSGENNTSIALYNFNKMLSYCSSKMITQKKQLYTYDYLEREKIVNIYHIILFTEKYSCDIEKEKIINYFYRNELHDTITTLQTMKLVFNAINKFLLINKIKSRLENKICIF